MSIASRYAGQASAEQASRDRLEIDRLNARVDQLEAEKADLARPGALTTGPVVTCPQHPLGCTHRCPHRPVVVTVQAPEPTYANGLRGVVLRLTRRVR